MHEPFDEAVQRHGATVLRVCRAVLGPGPDADDAWQETFLAALRTWSTWSGDGQDEVNGVNGVNLEAWLVRVAGRKAIDVIRSRGREAVPVETLPERAGAGTGAPEESVEIWSVVSALPERQRWAVAYHYLGGLPHAQTAELIGGSVDAVRRACADGLKALRSTLGDSTVEMGARR